jgi:hypothetical protein
MSACGTCTLCCKLLGVPDLTVPGKWCEHCDPGHGCAIYDRRPQQCRDFECGWLANHLHNPDFRPDRLHMIISAESEPLQAFIVHVDPAYPDAPDRPLGRRLIDALIKHGGKYQNVVLITGTKRRLVGTNAAAFQRRLDAFEQHLEALGAPP